MTFLQQNFYDKLAYAYQTKHEDAVETEMDSLSPLFSTLAQRNADISLARVQNIFKAIAAEHGSLVLSGFALTDNEVFKEYAVNDCGSYYNGEDHTCYPAVQSIDHNQTMGFAQLLRVRSDTRITQPVLSLNKTKLHGAEEREPLFKAIERLYSLTNHDWLHHLTMPLVNNDWVVKANRHCAFKDTLIDWNKGLSSPPEPYKHTAYEAWAVATHADMVAHSPETLSEIEETVAGFTAHLNTCIEAAPDEAKLKELAYLSKMACSALRYAFHPSHDIYMPLYDSVALIADKSSEALESGWNVKAANTQKLVDELVRTNAVCSLFEDTPAAKTFKNASNEATAQLITLLKANYPNS